MYLKMILIIIITLTFILYYCTLISYSQEVHYTILGGSFYLGAKLSQNYNADLRVLDEGSVS